MATDYQTSEYKGYQITSYKAKGNYGHYRISKVVRPNGSEVDGLAWGFKQRHPEYGTTSSNVGRNHAGCVEFVKSRIDCEIAGEEHPVDNRKRMLAIYRKIGPVEFEKQYPDRKDIYCL